MSVMEYRWEGGVIRITFKKTGNYRLIADGLPLHAREFIRLEDNHSKWSRSIKLVRVALAFILT